jgi:(5-formylfuran-3-yl)methyl phosphate synthase
MTLMLASVTGVEEAEVALRHGADIVDLKDAGSAFGAVAPAVIRATVESVARRRPVSAVIGEPEMTPAAVAQAVAAAADADVDYIKIGLYPDRRREDCIRALKSAARGAQLIGVMFADCGADESLTAVLAENGFAGVMVDTADKAGGRLLDHMNIAAIRHFVGTAHNCGLVAGLAGSLEAPDVPRLLLAAPDVLGFRRALCSNGDRTGRVSGEAIDILRALIPADSRHVDDPARPTTVDYRLLAARGYAPDKDEVETDRIFVRDFILPIRIGAYAHERDKPQDVCFNVDVDVLRVDRAAVDIRDVFSYDLITDSIRMIVAEEHIVLVEMLAERICALLLLHPRVNGVTVRVEKLQVGPGGAGVEIVRRRIAEVAKVHLLYPALGEAGSKTVK